MSIQLVIEKSLDELAEIAPGGYYIGLHIRVAAPLMTFNTYPQEWVDHYTKQAFALRDPTTAWGFSTVGFARWSEMGIPDPFEIMKQASEYGLIYGATISTGEISSRTIGSVSRRDREFNEDEMRAAENIVQRLHILTEPSESLTNSQVEALRCIAEGDRHAAAAAKLGISESALKARLTSAVEGSWLVQLPKPFSAPRIFAFFDVIR